MLRAEVKEVFKDPGRPAFPVTLTESVKNYEILGALLDSVIAPLFDRRIVDHTTRYAIESYYNLAINYLVRIGRIRKSLLINYTWEFVADKHDASNSLLKEELNKQFHRMKYDR